jgi:hypothetical protein
MEAKVEVRFTIGDFEPPTSAVLFGTRSVEGLGYAPRSARLVTWLLHWVTGAPNVGRNYPQHVATSRSLSPSGVDLRWATAVEAAAKRLRPTS